MKSRFVSIGIIIIIFFLFVVSLVFLYHVSFQDALQIALALPYVLFLPGWIWLHVILHKELKAFNVVEIITLSIALSMALVTVVIYLGSTLGGLKINAVNSFVVILGMSLVGAMIYFFTLKRTPRQFGETDSSRKG